VRSATRLDRLLDLRRHEEEQRLFELALAQQSVVDAQEALARLRERRAEIERALADSDGESIGEVQTLRLLLEQLDRTIQNAATIGALASGTAAEKEQKYMEARRSREALEKVIAPRVEEQRTAERLIEQTREDEVALIQFRSQRGSM
jgi:flagellar export protein FliJ